MTNDEKTTNANGKKSIWGNDEWRVRETGRYGRR